MIKRNTVGWAFLPTITTESNLGNLNTICPLRWAGMPTLQPNLRFGVCLETHPTAVLNILSGCLKHKKQRKHLLKTIILL